MNPSHDTPDAASWARLSPLLDEALDLPAHERSAWLADLRQRAPQDALQLQGLLERHAAADHAGPAVADAVAELRAMMTRGGAPAIAALERRVEELAGKVDAATGPAVDDLVDRLTAGIRAALAEQEMRRPAPAAQDELRAMMADLVDRFDAGRAGPIESDAFDALRAEIGRLSERLERAEGASAPVESRPSSWKSTWLAPFETTRWSRATSARRASVARRWRGRSIPEAPVTRRAIFMARPRVYRKAGAGAAGAACRRGRRRMRYRFLL